MEGVGFALSVFDDIKASVSAADAASYYGIHVGRNHMAKCVFHDDKTPSMKVDERYYCFGCGATGDAINLVAHLYGLRNIDAAKKIIDDFHLNIDMKDYKSRDGTIAARMEMSPEQKQRMLEKAFHDWEKHAYRVITDYY